MPDVLQLAHRLTSRPEIPDVAGVVVRTYAGADDVARFLELRERAFAREKLGVRRWTPEDFQTEFLSRSWWRPERFWLAETGPAGRSQPVGTITLALRGEGPTARAAMHWLAVAPGWRRCGVGRLLVATLEAAAIALGREVAARLRDNGAEDILARVRAASPITQSAPEP